MGELLYLWLRFCIEVPQIGIPVTLAVLAGIVVVHNLGRNAYRGSVIRRGAEALTGNRRAEALAALRQNDPAFDEPAFLGRVSAAFHKIQRAWCAQRLESVRPFISDGIFERFSLQLQEQREAGFHDQMEDTAVTGCVLSGVQSEGRFDTVTVCVSGTTRDFRADLKTNKPLDSRSNHDFCEYWTFLRHRGSQTRSNQAGLMEGVCPNCGAPIEMNQSANCLHCKALLRSGEYDWVLVEITQACEWRGQSSEPVPGLAALREHDPEFNRARLEDHASVMFWRWVQATRLGNSEPLKKIATPEYCQSFEELLAPANNPERSYLGECAVGCVELAGIVAGETTERALVEVRWDGVRYIVSGGQPRKTERTAIRRTLFVLRRKAGVSSATLDGVGSAHCPGCGAPETLGTAAACAYCGAVLNDGSLGWNLETVRAWYAPEATELLKQITPAHFQLGAAAALPPVSSPTPLAPRPDAVTLLSWLVKLAWADGTLSDDEARLLKSAAQKFGIGPRRLETLLAAGQNGALELREPVSRDECVRWLETLAEMALADGRVSNEEWDLLYRMGQRHGLARADINLLVQKTKLRLYQQARGELKKARQAQRS